MASEEAFPSLDPDGLASGNAQPPSTPAPATRKRGRSRTGSLTSSIASTTRARGASLLQGFANSNPPLGMWQATGEVGSKIPTLPEIKNGAFADEGWSPEGQLEHRDVTPHEIHRRRIDRTSSASTRTRKSTLGAATPATIPEHEPTGATYYFPMHAPISSIDEKAGVAGEDARQAYALTCVSQRPTTDHTFTRIAL